MHEQNKSEYFDAPKQKGATGLIVGSFLAIAGLGHLIRTIDGDILPRFLFTWQFCLILIGVLHAIFHKLRGNTWWILIVLGLFFSFSRDIYSFFRQFNIELRRFIFPTILIGAGILIFWRSRKKVVDSKSYTPPPTHNNSVQPSPAPTGDETPTVPRLLDDEEVIEEASTSFHEDATYQKRSGSNGSSDYTELSAIFGSNERIVVSKRYIGGRITSLFGGAVLDLHSADFESVVVIDVFCLCGGIDIIVPSNWSVKNETSALLGGIEDRRRNKNLGEPHKIVIIKGIVIMGGLEIKN